MPLDLCSVFDERQHHHIRRLMRRRRIARSAVRIIEDGEARGFDIELMQAVAAELGLAWRLAPYRAPISTASSRGSRAGRGIASRPGRRSRPTGYGWRRSARLTSDPAESRLQCRGDAERQVDRRFARHDPWRAAGQYLRARGASPKDEGRIAEARTYAYHDIGAMLDDLSAGKIGAVMKLRSRDALDDQESSPIAHRAGRDH